MSEEVKDETPAVPAEPAAAGVLEDVNIEEEMSRDYIDYSMSVIVGRALPDVRDGLKPVHRRCLFAMHELGTSWNTKHVKSARVVGEVIGKYHPHGDSSVYDCIVRLAQDFSLRLPLVDGHGNFGSIDGDPPAAMRYTEVRMQKVTDELLGDLEKDTVDMMPNFDETLQEPTVLPGKLPNLLLNGSAGIAVGMATNIPPHNLGELCDGIDYYVQHREECTVDDLMNFVKGPDFPTGAEICGKNGIAAMYKLGRGQLTVRGKAEVVTDKNGREKIVITEIPYGVNKREMITHMAQLVKDKVIEGVSDIRDISGGHTKDSKDSKGAKDLPKGRKLTEDDICIVVDLKRDAVGEIVLNHLYKHTALQTTFGAIILAIVGGRPKVLNLKEYFKCYVDHRFEVITRRTRFELKKAQARKHIVDGLLLAIDNLDEVVRIIRASKTRDEAKTTLQARFGFSDLQVNAILEMRLYQLVGLERDKLAEELAKLLAAIAEYEAILADPEKVYAIIRADLADLKLRYCSKEDSKRRTEIVADFNEVSVKDLIPDEPCVITLSNRGYVKRVPLTEYREQKRGGHGVRGAQVKEEDFIRLVFVAETHDELMFFTNTGRLFVKGAYEIPEAPRASFGRPLINLLNLQEGEQVLQLLPIRSFEGDVDVFFATKLGTVKKTLLGDYQNVNKSGIRAINIEEGDELVGVRLVKPSDDVVMLTRGGRAMRFAATDVRRMGRTATGVRGIRLLGEDRVVSLDAVDDEKTLFIATANGYGKRCEFRDFTRHGRGGQGMIGIKGADRNGAVVAAHAVAEDENVISITSDQQMVRSAVSDFSVQGRMAQGVKLVRLSAGATLVSVSVCDGGEEKPEGGEGPVKPTLVVLAAGMGSRYGGLKQVDPVGPSGEAILDYSVFDAVRAGFGKVVFVIRRDFEAEFKAKVGAKYEGVVPVEYCYQDFNDLPAPFTFPEGRTKPWGTAHAVRAARGVVREPFAVINADDFYGRDAFAKLAAALSGAGRDADKMHLFMAAYRLDLTLSENGSVARGICDVTADGTLKGVTEMTKLVKAGDTAENREDEANPTKVPLDARVSMNCWGFSPKLFGELEERFVKFLAARGTEMKSEWYIPFVVDELIKEGKADCHVLPTDARWFGVTYREDKPFVVGEIAKLVAAGEYPEKLF